MCYDGKFSFRWNTTGKVQNWPEWMRSNGTVLFSIKRSFWYRQIYWFQPTREWVMKEAKVIRRNCSFVCFNKWTHRLINQIVIDILCEILFHAKTDHRPTRWVKAPKLNAIAFLVCSFGVTKWTTSITSHCDFGHRKSFFDVFVCIILRHS